MNSNFVIQNLTLKISNVTESHTGEHIHSFLKNTLREWNLHNEEFNIFFVTDNAANIVKAIRLNRTWERIPRFAHTLQLVIKDAIKPCSELVTLLTKCRRIVRYFHRSSAANQKLKREQLAQYPGRTPLKLIIDCETRWNSQYDMLNRLMNVRRALHTVLCEPRMPDAITSREWAEIEEYSTCLKLFKEATEIMTVENTPTLPRYIPTVYGIRDTLMNMLENDNPSEISVLKNNFIIELGSRFYFATSTDSLLVSMILDPRIKNRLLPIERKEQAKDILEKFANKYSKSSITNNAGVADENVEASSIESSQSLFSFFKNVARNEGQPINILQHQIETYLTEKLIAQESCILEWWRQNSTRFPELAVVARNLFGIPASQAYSERLFSLAGNI
ncbi:E3 SUMO-protein ligase ZBED1-like [Lasioglossum baleicum]|uniref:E3 SUMO-protein ligase ZBED1-like n=1 Tax=Lasioglossum baleicum TaxID=434251 RepID=UPI003FCE6F22